MDNFLSVWYNEQKGSEDMKQRTEYEKNCAHCEHAGNTYDDEYVICIKKGIVRSHGCCRKFIYDPLKRKTSPYKPSPKLEYINIDEV